MLVLKKDYKEVINYLNAEKVICLPTETVMGLAALVDSKKAYDDLISIKNRPKNKSFPLAFSSLRMIKKYAKVTKEEEKIIKKFLPGPLTLILEKKDTVPSYVLDGKSTIACRIPNDYLIRKIIHLAGKPLLLTSANKSGMPSLINSEEVIKEFKEEIPLVIKGECKYNIASTIALIKNGKVEILREGIITKEEIEKELNL